MISIKFQKRTERSKVVRDSKFRDDSTKDDQEETDFVTSVDRNKIHGTKKVEVKKELVIPLIARNEWRGVVNSLVKEIKQEDDDDQPLSLEEQAIKELLGQPSLEHKAVEDEDDLPLLLQNQVPKGFEEDDNMDVSLRPDQSSLQDYERVPIEEFGMAMLRGMGWSKKEGIGLTNKQNVEMIEPQLRPKGLGLGATISAHAAKQVQNSQGKKDEEELLFKIGVGAVIQRGPDKGMYGRVEAFDEDNNRVMIKLAISGKMSTVSKFYINLVKEIDYKVKSKVLNYDQYAEYKEKQEVKDQERRTQKEAAKAEEDRSKSHKKSKHDHHEKNKKSKRDKDKLSNGSSCSSSGNSKSIHSRNWVRPHLKVRFIDKKYKHGLYYEKKFIVEDVLAIDRYVLKSESGGTLLEDITSSQLETVIPKGTGTAVCILSGRYKGHVGELVERNRSEEMAVIKIPDGHVYELSYDDICEFVGDPEEFY